SGYSLAHAMMMMMPEAWQNHPEMTPEKQAFYEYHEHLMEPWDGPAAMAFTDGRQIGAILDRNGLRPARYVRTKDDLIVMASEVGAVGLKPEEVAEKGRLQPGKMFLVDLEEGRVIDDTELKQQICGAQPYQQWLDEHMLRLSDLPEPTRIPESDFETLLSRQKVFGYTTEDVNVLLTPMATEGDEATGSMGNDTPLAVLSDRPRLLYDYFKQIFAQVSNPAIDSIREELVMSLTVHLGYQRNILDPGPEHAHMLKIEHPVLTNAQMAQLREMDHRGYRTETLSLLFSAQEGPDGMARALQQLCKSAEAAVREGCPLLVLSDRGVDAENVPIPALLATGAVHHHLIRKRMRHKAGLIVETGEVREIAHFCLLVGYGAGAVNPYLAFESFEQMLHDGILPNSLTFPKVEQNFLKAIRKGMFKVFAKMGISTLQSYNGAQIFEAVGLNEDVVREHFAGTPSRISGVGLETIAKEALIRHYEAYLDTPDIARTLDVGGHYYWRRRGEFHQINPISTDLLQKAAQGNNPEAYQRFSQLANDQSRKLATPRGVLEFTTAAKPVPLSEVEPASEIVKRFVTGAMSLGSISKEAHETLAVAMNRIGARSNSGEGGEDGDRYAVRENGDWPISKIKQVASGRFGVTIHYLVNSTELQIKVAQGAKPGEGGQLPGRKVSEYIAKVRYSTPGVTLISPPPHHDIYSIEDLAQLIFDLKNSNPEAKINVKLVSEAGVGTIAAGVAKAHADIITIAGHDGGTGAAPLTSIKHAGVPWELGISEAQQALLLNKLRGRVRLQTDGQLKTGRDVVIAALLGAEEFGFSTAPLIAIGCIMMRKCHLNTCPVGIATQDPELRKKFVGQPEHVINFFFFVAEEVRELMASLGVRTFNKLIGRTDLLVQNPPDHWKAKDVDLSAILHQVPVGEGDSRFCSQLQDHGLAQQLDHRLIEQAQAALERQKPVRIKMPVKNTDRAVGTMLSSRIAKRYGEAGLPDGTIHCRLTGTSGQSFGAFLAQGVTLELEGDSNDYTGKGLSGGRLIIYPWKVASYKPDENIIIGNTVLYGATSGEAYFRGIAGERFAVRNSGAIAVVEGVGDHGCEYMTGGRVIVLGRTGRNFAAGMSGGVAYVFDENRDFATRCNPGMVELEPIQDPEEQQWIREQIERHRDFTGSDRADRLLRNWGDTLSRFVRVMPTEYRAVLERLEAKAA
ncbi:MAG TPA: glutamate synthase large subunit, partial [Deltaproteobacteria bacterium]|nr:glutamate synthase large subunit [Deltaproteobacteria bacterium]